MSLDSIISDVGRLINNHLLQSVGEPGAIRLIFFEYLYMKPMPVGRSSQHFPRVSNTFVDVADVKKWGQLRRNQMINKSIIVV